ncbi:MAG: hypothetical protein AB8B55_21415, partial [Mariniblastus sp.]
MTNLISKLVSNIDCKLMFSIASVAILAFAPLPVVAQGDSNQSKSKASDTTTAQAKPTRLAPTQLAPIETQTKLVRAIYDATKKAKTATDYTAFLKQCDEALNAGLSKKNHQYVASLTGWAYNRRAEKRLELVQ